MPQKLGLEEVDINHFTVWNLNINPEPLSNIQSFIKNRLNLDEVKPMNVFVEFVSSETLYKDQEVLFMERVR